MSDARLNNPFPEEFGYLRIGTPIDSTLGNLYHLSRAFDNDKLAGAGLLAINVNTSTAKEIKGDASSSADQTAWGLGFAVNGGGKNPFVQVSLNAHFEMAMNHASANSMQSLTATAISRGQIALVSNPTEQQLLACGTDDFVAKMTALQAAKTDDEFLKAYCAFVGAYGTGFVSKLNLVALGVMVAEAAYDNETDEKNFSGGGGVSVGTPFVSVSVQAEMSMKRWSARSSGKFSASSFGLPDGSSAATWAEDLATEFSGVQIGKLAELKTVETTFAKPVARASEPQFVEKSPSKDVLPHFSTTSIEKSIRAARYTAFAEDYKKKNPGSPPPALDAFEAYEKEERQKLKQKAKTLEAEAVAANPPQKLHAKAAPRLSVHAPVKRHRSLAAAPGADGSTLGGYAVAGYEYTPWGAVFPGLKVLENGLSLSQLNVGKVMAWVAIRAMICQYLTFCGRYQDWSDIDASLHPAADGAGFFPGLASEAKLFNSAFRNMQQCLIQTLELDDDPIADIESAFIDELKRKKFRMLKHYDFIKKNYSWLQRIPFGVVVAIYCDGMYYYESNCDAGPGIIYKGGGTDLSIAKTVKSRDNPAIEMLKNNACRLFPIIADGRNGDPNFVWAGAGAKYKDASHAEIRWTNALGLLNFDTGHVQNRNLSSEPDGKYDNFSIHENFRSDMRSVAFWGRFMSDTTRIIPADGAGLDDPFWTLRPTPANGQPDGLVVQRADGGKFLLSCGIGKHYVDTVLGLPAQYGQLFFVPIGYDQVQTLTFIESGGGPMWVDPGIDKIIAGLTKD